MSCAFRQSAGGRAQTDSAAMFCGDSGSMLKRSAAMVGRPRW